jgi:phage repressor protein C with HTH and peptisase S24 domain
VKTTDGKITAKIIHKKTVKRVELAPFNSPKIQVVDMKNIEWMARIIWASQ